MRRERKKQYAPRRLPRLHGAKPRTTHTYTTHKMCIKYQQQQKIFPIKNMQTWRLIYHFYCAKGQNIAPTAAQQRFVSHRRPRAQLFSICAPMSCMMLLLYVYIKFMKGWAVWLVVDFASCVCVCVSAVQCENDATHLGDDADATNLFATRTHTHSVKQIYSSG